MICLQALRAVSHNYPSTVKRTWKQVLAIINDLLQIENLGDLSYGVVSRSLKGDIEKTVGSTAEKSIVAGIKVISLCILVIAVYTQIFLLFGDTFIFFIFIKMVVLMQY